MKHIQSIKVQSVVPSGNSLLKNLHRATSLGRTQNDAVTFIRTESSLLDFYAQAGAMRNSPDKALDLFKKAFAEDRQKAVRILFYLRDVRGGQGERKLFRTCLEWLGTDVPEVFEQIISYVSEYGRWDDLFFDNEECFTLLGKQLKKDKKSETLSLLAKWLPTLNASSKSTQAKAEVMAKGLALHPIEYRKTLVAIRKKIKIVESQMSANEWKEIDYSAVPSQASRIYKNAFKEHDEKRYSKFIEKAEKGEVRGCKRRTKC